MVWPPGQSIGFVKSAGFVDDGEIVLEQKEGPTCLAAGEFLFGAKVGKVIMVSPNFKGNRVSFEVMTERFESTDNSKEFFVMNIVI
jgi:hypothetical protein